ncbi:MAG: aromatic amino acid lyase [Xanthomonadales bacterium]|mgnify:CR=1 FL=1|nr:aromatic amino acid lyase [Xanthomonadales bacterium]
MTQVDKSIVLDGGSLTRAQLVAAACQGVSVTLDAAGLQRVQRAAEFLADKVNCGEPTYGVTTGFGSNADKLLGTQRVRDGLPGAATSGAAKGSLMDELQHNLIITHAVCVGEPMSAEVVRAMLVIRINTLMRGHSGIRVGTLQALTSMLNAGVVPVVPEKGSVGASGDLAPLSHLAIVLLGAGEAFYQGERLPGGEALKRAGLVPVRLSFKEGLALNNGTAQMLAMATLALDAMERLLDTAELAAAMSLEAFAGRSGALRADVHALRPHPGQVETAAHVRDAVAGSTLIDIPYHLVPRFQNWSAEAWSEPDDQALSFDIAWDWVPANRRQGREAFYRRFLPFKGGKKVQPQDAYSLRCMPQVHGAVRDAWLQACRVVDVELNAVTDNPLIFPENADQPLIEDQVISAGHFHGMPLALVLAYVKAAIPVLASISERRLNKLVDPANNDGLPAFLTGNEDATDSGFMIVQYTAAALVNDLATRAHPACVYSIPTSANAEDHVSMGANEARHVLDMTGDLGRVLALELYTAAQALDYREAMLHAAQRLARRGGWQALARKMANAPREGDVGYPQFATEVQQLATALGEAGDFHAGDRVQRAHAVLRQKIDFLHRDRALDGDIQAVCALVAEDAFRQR